MPTRKIPLLPLDRLATAHRPLKRSLADIRRGTIAQANEMLEILPSRSLECIDNGAKGTIRTAQCVQRSKTSSPEQSVHCSSSGDITKFTRKGGVVNQRAGLRTSENDMSYTLNPQDALWDGEGAGHTHAQALESLRSASPRLVSLDSSAKGSKGSFATILPS